MYGPVPLCIVYGQGVTRGAAPLLYRVRPPYTVYTKDARVRPSQMPLGTAPKISPVFKGSLSPIFVIQRRPSPVAIPRTGTCHSSTFGTKEGYKELLLTTLFLRYNPRFTKSDVAHVQYGTVR